jgi:hypothetical protein
MRARRRAGAVRRRAPNVAPRRAMRGRRRVITAAVPAGAHHAAAPCSLGAVAAACALMKLNIRAAASSIGQRGDQG